MNLSIPDAVAKVDGLGDRPELLLPLFHQLNNQIGIILAHAELLEAKAQDETTRVRAAQVVRSALEAMGTARELRRRSETACA